MGLTADRELSLRYEQNEDTKLIGRLFARGAKQQWVPVPWDTLPPVQAIMQQVAPADGRAPAAWHFSPLRLFTVFAAEVGAKGMFGSSGEYQSEFGRNLRSWLGGANVALQQRGVQVLVDARARAFKFIADSQTVKLPADINRSVLTGNLMRAVVEIEASRTPVPADLVVSLAVASSRNGNYEWSARFFDKVREKPLAQIESYFYRGLAYRETGRYKEAIDDLERYARDVTSRTRRPWPTRPSASPYRR